MRKTFYQIWNGYKYLTETQANYHCTCSMRIENKEDAQEMARRNIDWEVHECMESGLEYEVRLKREQATS